MANKRKTRSAPRPAANGKSRPVSFRLGHGLVARVDASAGRVGVPRNRLVSLVLQHYLVDRGDEEIERIIRERDADAAQINLFA